MKLVKAQIKNFRSVEDSGEFDITQIVCLIGKNEAGKSALLQALAALNPHPSTLLELDKERDYPRRHLASYAELHPKEPAAVVLTEWEFDDGELATLEEMLGKASVDRRLRVQRRYGEDLTIDATIDTKKIIKHLFAKFGVTGEEAKALAGAATTAQLIEELNALPNPSESQINLRAHLLNEGTAIVQVHKFVAQQLPRFMYVSSYDRMEGTVQFQQLQELQDQGSLDRDEHRGKKLFVEFLRYAGISPADLLRQTNFETHNALLQAASNKITDQILEYWTQSSDLSVEVRVSAGMAGDPPPLQAGNIARARIYNALHRVDTPFSERSSGFVWFFSFLVRFAQVRNESAPVILLLDEPGLTLHGKAQLDLLRFFREKLAPHHQIIFSTHSSFMVPAGDLASVRVVQDAIEQRGARRIPLGTKVVGHDQTQDADALLPLKVAISHPLG